MLLYVEEGVSSEPCSDIYRGESAGSEPEIQVIMKFGRELVERYPTGHVSNNPMFIYCLTNQKFCSWEK